MMFKFAGAVLVTLSCAFSGYAVSELNRYRLQDIEEMKKAVSFYKGCVNAMGLTVSEALNETSKRIKGAVKKMFEETAERTEKREHTSVDEIWTQAVKNNLHSSFFKSEDVETVLSFGVLPGFMDRQQQSETADLIINELENAEEKVRQKCLKEERIFRSSGVLCGLLLSILMF